MDRHDERLNISALGADVILRPSGATPVEGELTYDVIGHPRGLVVQPHVHPAQEERFAVLAGEMRLVIGRRSHILGPGDRMSVPAGVVHRQLAAGEDDIRKIHYEALRDMRPAQQSAEEVLNALE